MVKKIIQQIRNGIAGQWTQPVFSGEIRHIIPTSVGLPLEYALYSTALARAAVNGELCFIRVAIWDQSKGKGI